MASPICKVADGVGDFSPTTNGVDITPGNTISIKLDDATDVVAWYLEVVGTDELYGSSPTLIGVNATTHQVASPATIVTYTNPNAEGRAVLFRSTVVAESGSYVATFALFNPTAKNLRVGAVGQTREGNSVFGWAAIVNPLVRADTPLDDVDQKGGHQTVANASERDAITTAHRKVGMFVVTQDDGKVWQLDSNLTTWTEFTGGGGGGLVPGPRLSNDVVEVVDTEKHLRVGFVAPRSLLTEGSTMYVAQSNQNEEGSSVLWKLTVSGSTITEAVYVDLKKGPLGFSTVTLVGDIAIDSTYLYAACWDLSRVAIIEKATMTLVGWGFTGYDTRALSVTADNSGNFYTLSSGPGGGTWDLQKFSVASCLGKNGGVSSQQLSLTASGRRVRHLDGKLFLTFDGGDTALQRVNPTTLLSEVAVPDIDKNISTLDVISAFGSLWVTVPDSPDVLRVDASDLTATATITVPFVDAMSVGQICIGPDSAGVADRCMWVTGASYREVFTIDPNTEATTGPVLMHTDTELEGIAAIGGYVYPASVGKDRKIFAVQASSATVDWLLPATTTPRWAQQYTRLSGDLRGPLNESKVHSLDGVLTPSGKTAVVGHVPTVVATQAFSATNRLVWDTYANRLWVCGSGTPVKLLAFDPSTYALDAYDLIYGDPSVTSIADLAYDEGYLYVLLGSVGYSVAVIDRRTMEVVATVTGIDRPTAIVKIGGDLWVTTSSALFKFTVSSLLTTSNPVKAGAPTFTLPSTSAYSMVTDGTYLYITDALGARVLKFDPSSTSIVATTTTERFALDLVLAKGYLWVTEAGRIGRIDLADMSITETSVSDGTVPLTSVAFDGVSKLWTASRISNCIYIFDISTGSAVQVGVVLYPNETDASYFNRCLAFQAGSESLWAAVVNRDTESHRILGVGAQSANVFLDYTGPMALDYQPVGASGASGTVNVSVNYHVTVGNTIPSARIYRFTGERTGTRALVYPGFDESKDFFVVENETLGGYSIRVLFDSSNPDAPFALVAPGERTLIGVDDSGRPTKIITNIPTPGFRVVDIADTDGMSIDVAPGDVVLLTSNPALSGDLSFYMNPVGAGDTTGARVTLINETRGAYSLSLSQWSGTINLSQRQVWEFTFSGDSPNGPWVVHTPPYRQVVVDLADADTTIPYDPTIGLLVVTSSVGLTDQRTLTVVAQPGARITVFCGLTSTYGVQMLASNTYESTAPVLRQGEFDTYITTDQVAEYRWYRM